MSQRGDKDSPRRKRRTREHVIEDLSENHLERKVLLKGQEPGEGFPMSHQSQNEITFEGLQQFLRRVGFDQPARIDNSLAFHHRDSGTIIVLSIPKDNRSVRSADLLSVLMRLEAQGLVDDWVLEHFKSGKLPMAS